MVVRNQFADNLILLKTVEMDPLKNVLFRMLNTTTTNNGAKCSPTFSLTNSK